MKGGYGSKMIKNGIINSSAATWSLGFFRRYSVCHSKVNYKSFFGGPSIAFEKKQFQTSLYTHFAKAKNVLYQKRPLIISPRHHHHHHQHHQQQHKWIVRSISQKKNTNENKKETISDLIHFLGTVSIRIATGISIAYLLDEYVFCFTLCEGPSMMPTIHPKGEIILVERFTHRIFGLDGGYTCEQRVSRAKENQRQWKRALLQEWKRKQKSKAKQQYKTLPKDNLDFIETWHQKPRPLEVERTSSIWTKLKRKFSTGVQVGDVVVVRHPLKEGTVCKRIIGLPGDIIVQKAQHNLPLNYSGMHPRNNHQREHLCVIPDGQIWMEGDNTPNSSDSRAYGAVPAALISGKVVCRMWPLRGNAFMDCADRPLPPPERGAVFTGSVVIPAGYEGEAIIQDDFQTDYESQ